MTLGSERRTLNLRIRPVISAVLFAAMLAGCERQQGPSLSDTLSWLDQTYNPYKDGVGGHGSYMFETLSFRETLTYNGCQITTITISSRKGDHGLREQFNLRDIDPQSIRVVNNPNPGTVAEVEFVVRNNAEMLTYSGNVIGTGARSQFGMD